MSIRDLFSTRAAKAARPDTPDVYEYDDLSKAFRRQVVHIFNRAVGNTLSRDPFSGCSPGTEWERIEQRIAEEHALFHLGANNQDEDPQARCINYFLTKDAVHALDVIEAIFNAITEDIDHSSYAHLHLQNPSEAISDLNQRFQNHAIGYQYANGQIIRIDSQYVHAEAVKPALAVLQEPGFSGAQDEFMQAHRHYREGNNKEAINEALKAFESTMKCICERRHWNYDKTKATAKPLLDVLFANALVPAFLQSSFAGLRSVLEGGVPTTRNRTSGHGQGSEPTECDWPFRSVET